MVKNGIHGGRWKKRTGGAHRHTKSIDTQTAERQERDAETQHTQTSIYEGQEGEVQPAQNHRLGRRGVGNEARPDSS